MRKSFFSTALVTLLASLAAGVLPTATLQRMEITQTNDTNVAPFYVYVAGKGVPLTNPDLKATLGKKTENDADQDGMDTWNGANVAYRDLVDRWSRNGGSQQNGKLFDLLTFDDGNDAKNSEDFARKVQSDARVLAVIGHTASQATRAAAETYAQAGIPLIMPEATAPEADLDKDSRRLRNCFRLQPSDDKAQAPAMAYLVEQLDPKHTAKVHIVMGAADGARMFSTGLGKKVGEILETNGFGHDDLDQEDLGEKSGYVIKTVAHDIENLHHHGGGDVIVFCGYEKEANDFLSGLTEVYQGPADKRPTVIFAELGSKIEQKSGGFRIYRASPLDTTSCPRDSKSAELAERVSEAAKARGADEVSGISDAFMYGYDAMKILGQAVKNCNQRSELSRACVLSELQSGAVFPSGCFAYSFHDGENSVSGYYVFRSREACSQAGEPWPACNPGNQEAPHSFLISPSEILHMRAPKDLSP